jgi:hypothetical protein
MKIKKNTLALVTKIFIFEPYRKKSLLCLPKKTTT